MAKQEIAYIPEEECPSGYHWSRLEGKCVPDTTPPPPPPPPPVVCPVTWPWPFSLVEVALCNLSNWIGQAAVLAVQPVSDWLANTGAWIAQQVYYGLDYLGSSIAGFFSDLGTFLTEGFDFVGSQLSSFFDALAANISAGLTIIGDTITATITSITDFVGTGFAALTETVGTIIDNIWTAISTGFDALATTVCSAVGGLFDSLTGLAGDIADSIGNAIGQVLQFIWTTLSGAASAIAQGIITITAVVADTVSTYVVQPLTGLITSAVESILPGSPPTEIEQASLSIANAMIGFMGRHSPEKGSSPPDLPTLLAESGGLTAGIIGMYMLTHAVSLGLDLAHPIKNPGFKAAIMDIMHTFDIESVIGPVVQAPIWASLVVPLRMRYAQLFPYQIPNQGQLIQMRNQGIISQEFYEENMAYHALDVTWSEFLRISEERIPSFGDLSQMLWRGIISLDELKEAQQRNQVPERFIPGYEALLQKLPGTQDLITMMVREVITPADFIVNMAKQGFIETWSLNYYEMHWVLLPLGKVQEARYRGYINDEELFTYLKLHDYKPDPRPGIATSDQEIASKLIWSIPGRIEGRWMYKWGFIDQEGLRDLLVKDGMDPQYAPIVAAATARNQMLAEINRLRDNTKIDYNKGFITEAQLRSDLEALGYGTDMIEFSIADAQADAERALLLDAISTIGDGYLKDLVTDEDLPTLLANYIVRPEVVDNEVQRLWIRKYKKPSS